MQVKIKETYSDKKLIELEIEASTFQFLTETYSKILKEDPALEMVEIICEDPQAKITLTR